MRNIIYSLLTFLTTILTYQSSFAGYYNWAKRFGDAAVNVDVGKSIVSDKQGNVYLTGLFKGTVDFDPGNGISNLVAGGTNENIFFAKFNSNGNFIWAKHIGDANLSKGLNIQVDDTGNVYLLANFEQSTSLDFDPGVGIANVDGQGSKTIAFAKYTSSGDYVWAKSISGVSDCYATSFKVEHTGAIYLAGKFYLTADFDPSAASANLTSTGTSNGFFAKYDNNGNYIWANQLTGGTVEPSQCETDNLGNIYLTGFYRGTCDFNPDAVGQYIRSNDGNSDFFVARYTENGAFTWAIALDGTNEDFGNSIAVDNNQNVYVVGTFIDSLETDPSPVDNYLVSASTGISDNFIAKYDALGNSVWAFKIGNAQSDFCNSIAIDLYGFLYITGTYTGNVDFDPSASINMLSAGSSYNIYMANYDENGVFGWARDIGGIQYDEALDISIDRNSNIYITGYFGDDVDFDPSPDDTASFNGGTVDIFMAKFSGDQPLSIKKPYDFASWFVDATYPITWQSNGIDSVKIERQQQGQTAWELIANVPDSPAVLNYFLPANNPLDTYTLRISDLLNHTVKHQHTVKVKFSPQLNYPVGAEVFNGDSLITINWFASGVSSAFFDLKYSINGGANWFKMRDSVQTFYDTDSNFYIGNYNWQIPRGVNSAICKVGIFGVNLSTPLFASNNFSIIPPSPTSFQILSPNGGEVLERKKHHYITWTGVSMPPVVVLYYSLDGATYYVIDTVANTGYYDWRVRDTVSTDCYIKVGNLAQTILDESDATFSIVNSLNDDIVLIAPALNDNWCEGTQQYIRWTSNYNGKITLWLKRNSGSDDFIDTVEASDGMYFWTVPASTFSGNRIRIEPADGSGSNLSTSDYFTICPNFSFVKVLLPNGGENYYPGAYAPITWDNNYVDTVAAYYSIDNGVNWNLIQAGITQSPYFWLVPDSTSTTCLIKIEAAGNPTLSDVSDAVFTIKPAYIGLTPIITTTAIPTAPCKADTFSVFYTVSGGPFDTSNTFIVQLSDSLGNFNGAFTGIGMKKDSISGSVLCKIPASVKNGSLYSLRVLADNPPSTGTSIPAFSLESPEFSFRDSSEYYFLPNAVAKFPVIPILANDAIEWKFGDGTFSSLTQPTHTYTHAGIFDVTVKVTNINGCSTSKTNARYVKVDKKFPNRVLNPNAVITVTGISFKNDSTGTISFADGSVKFTNDYGVNWYAVQATGLSDVQAVKAKNAFEWIVVGSNGGVRKTLNRGLSWDTVTFASGALPTVKLNAVDFSSVGTGYIAGDSGKVFRFFAGKFVAAPQFTHANLYTVYDNGTDAFVAGDSGKIVKRNAGGWSQKNSGLTTPIRSIVFATENPLKGYAVGDQGKVVQSNDAGETWSLSLSGVDINFSSVACSEMGDSAWAVGEAGIIYQTIDFGQTWERFSKGSTTANTRVTFRKPRGYIAGSSGSLRIFNPVNNQLTLGVKSLQKTASLDFSVFPNPVKNQFSINCDVANFTAVTISIQDINGKELMHFIAHKSGLGFQKTVDVSKFNNGIYFIHLSTEKEYLIKKIVVLN